MTFQLPLGHHKTIRALIITAALIVGLSVLVSLVQLHKVLAIGFAFDFLLTVPLLYLLLIRKTSVPAITAVPLSIGMLLLAYVLFPEAHHQYLDYYKVYALPVLELLVVGMLFIKLKKARGVLKSSRGEADFYDRLQMAAEQAFSMPRVVAAVVATEAAIFYYAIAAFRKIRWQKGFSYHRETALMAIVFALMLLVVVETIAVHLLIMRWSVIAANILSFLSLYSLFYVLALAGAAKHRPHVFLAEGLLVRFGLQETLIPYEQITSLERLKGELPEEKSILKLGVLDNFNLILKVREPQQLKSFYGIRRKYTTVAFWADDPEAFITAFQAETP